MDNEHKGAEWIRRQAYEVFSKDINTMFVPDLEIHRQAVGLWRTEDKRRIDKEHRKAEEVRKKAYQTAKSWSSGYLSNLDKDKEYDRVLEQAAPISNIYFENYIEDK